MFKNFSPSGVILYPGSHNSIKPTLTKEAANSSRIVAEQGNRVIAKYVSYVNISNTFKTNLAGKFMTSALSF